MAADGPEALHACATHTGEIHLVLTDVVMPGMDGGTLAGRLAEIRPGIKVLFMSGYSNDRILDRAGPDRGRHFIGKPFEDADLMQKVREVIDGVD